MGTAYKDDKWLLPIKSKLGNHSEPLPKDGWDDLETRLRQKEKGHNAFSIKSRWMRVAGIAALVAVLACLFILLHNSAEKTGVDLKQVKVAETVTPKGNDVNNEQQEQIQRQTKQTQEQMQPATNYRNTVAASVGKHVEKTTASAENTMKMANNDVAQLENGKSGDKKEPEKVKETANENDKNIVNETERIKKQDEHHPSKEYTDEPLYAFEPVEKKHGKGGWSTEVRVGGIGGADKNENAANDGLVLNSDVLANSVYMSDDVASRFKIGMTRVKLHHSPPLRISLLAGKQFNDFLSVQTGITYMYLYSEAADESLRNEFKQHVHYLGIPLRVNLHFFNRGGFSAYWSNGIEAEKCISARYGNESFSIHKLQFGVTTALGCQYKLSLHTAIFAEPGVSYFWGNRDDVETYVTNNKAVVNLNFGLKFTY
jgi:hypothetical protein